MTMIAAIKQGDENAFREAFFHYRKKLEAFFLKKCNDPQDASDLVQTTFLKLWQYRASLNEDYELGQHIFQIAKTVFIDYLRKQNKQKHQKIAPSTDWQPVAQGYQPEYDMRQKLHLALQGMPEMRKKVFELNRLEGYSYLEIANIFSISVKSVDNHISKAVRHLRKIFSWITVFSVLLS
jgi:RNA polymerase sigma factor (sigma-70 family)